MLTTFGPTYSICFEIQDQPVLVAQYMSWQQRAEKAEAELIGALRLCVDLRGRAETAEAFHASLQVHVDSLRADLQKVVAENDEFRQRWSKKAHELHLARQKIAELVLKLLPAKKLPEPTDTRKAQDAAVGRALRFR